MKKVAFGILAVLLLYLAAANLQLRQREHFLEERLAAAERKPAPRTAPPPQVDPELPLLLPPTPAEAQPLPPKSAVTAKPESVPQETAKKPPVEITIDSAQLAGNTFTLKMPRNIRTRDLGLSEAQKKAIDDLKKYRDSETQRYSALTREIEAQVEESIRGILTSEQRAKYDAQNSATQATATVTTSADPNTASGPKPGYLGVSGGDAAGGGAEVMQVFPNTPASTLGLQPGDVILEFNGQPVPTLAALATKIRENGEGVGVMLKIRRGGSEFTQSLLLSSYPK